MSKYLKSYKKYPAGSLVVTKRQNIWKRIWYVLTGKRRPYTNITVLPKDTYIGITKWDKFRYDYHLFVPIVSYKHSELVKLRNLLKSCATTEDILVAINTVREDSIDTKNLDNLKDNSNYYKLYLEQEPFQDMYYDITEK